MNPLKQFLFLLVLILLFGLSCKKKEILNDVDASYSLNVFSVHSSEYDRAISVCGTQDGGFVVLAENGEADFILLKYDSLSNLLWEEKYMHHNSRLSGTQVIEDLNGDLVVLGNTNGNGFVFKFNSEGWEEWSREYEFPDDENIGLITMTPDGGYILGGSYEKSGLLDYSPFLFRIDSEGIVQWSEKIATNGTESISSILNVNNDDFLILAGSSYHSRIILIDDNSDVLWEKKLDGISVDRSKSGLIETLDSGYLIAGVSDDFGANYNIITGKMDEDFNYEWAKTLGGYFLEEPIGVLQGSNGGIFVIGNSSSYGNGSGEFYLAKLNTAGDIIWSKVYGGEVFDYAIDLSFDKFENIIICGSESKLGKDSFSKMLILKVDQEGNPI